MQVLAGVDGSERSFAALRFVSRLLAPDRDQVTLYFSPPHIKLSGDSDLAPNIPELASSALADSVFDEAKRHLPNGLREAAVTIRGEQEPTDGILAAADQVRADLIVVAAHAATRRLHLFLGGVARGVAHRSTKPVLVVRDRPSPDSDGMKVLVACNDNRVWQKAAAVLGGLSLPSRTDVTLFHVVEAMDEDYLGSISAQEHLDIPNAASLIEEYQSQIKRQKEVCLETLMAARKELPASIQGAEPEVAQGHVVEQIVNRVIELKVDLVVVAARRLGWLHRMLGSTTEGLLIQCPCSMLIVHQAEKP